MLYYLACVLKPLFFLIFRPRIENWKGLFFRGPAVIVSNHWSFADPILIACMCPRPIHFMAKASLFEKPLAARVLRSFFAFPVNQNTADMRSLRKAQELLKEGKVFGIFPEGRRSLTGGLDRFEKGAAFLALRADVPIIPVYSDPWSFSRMRSRMIVGKPLSSGSIPEGYPGKPVDAVTQAIRDSLQDMANRMGGAASL